MSEDDFEIDDDEMEEVDPFDGSSDDDSDDDDE